MASFGRDLPDQFELVAKVSDAQIALLSDLRDALRERAILEREYATKLQALSKKTAEKKSKRISMLVLGDNPTRVWDAQTLHNSTLNVAYSQFITFMDTTAQDHITLADAIATQVMDPLKVLEQKQDAANKKQVDFFTRLVQDRDQIYADRIKARQKYHDECVEFEACRQRQTRAQDDKHTERAAKQVEQQRVEMLNSKSIFILNTAAANTTKDAYYSKDIPELENQSQNLQSHTVSRLTELILRLQSFHHTHAESLDRRCQDLQAAWSNVDAAADQKLFVEFNARPFVPPSDFDFEPCQSYYDKPELSTEPEPKTFLQNRLRMDRIKLNETDAQVAKTEEECNQLDDVLATHNKQAGLGDVGKVLEDNIHAHHQLMILTVSQRLLRTTVQVMSDFLAGDEGLQKPHSFKNSSFSIPTQCAYCKTSIWGLSKQGKTCRFCGSSVHAKCELKLPANCSKSEAIQRTTSRASTTSSIKAPKLMSVVNASHTKSTQERRKLKVLYEFEGSSDFELSVPENAVVEVVEEDDGSGWLKVSNGRSEGLIPSAYTALLTREITIPVHSHNAPQQQQGCGLFVKAVYDYEAQGDDEISLKEGDRIELSVGGKEVGDGQWWEGYDSHGRKGLFPSSYVEEMS